MEEKETSRKGNPSPDIKKRKNKREMGSPLLLGDIFKII